jgi:hypothetical protein
MRRLPTPTQPCEIWGELLTGTGHLPKPRLHPLTLLLSRKIGIYTIGANIIVWQGWSLHGVILCVKD